MSLWDTNLGPEAGAQVMSDTASPAHGDPARTEPSPLTAQGTDCSVTQGPGAPAGHVLVTARCPGGHSCSWEQQPSLGSGDVPPVPPHCCEMPFPSPRFCVGLIWISFSIPFVPGKMKLPKSPNLCSPDHLLFITLSYSSSNQIIPTFSCIYVSLCFCRVFSAAGAELREGVPLQVTLLSWEQPQGSGANACNEQRSSPALHWGAISFEAAMEQ